MGHLKFKKTEPKWKPGDAVVLWSDSTKTRCRKEYGRVISTRWDKKFGWWDCYVAFFGWRWPTDNQLKFIKPYVLRYLETSLRAYVPKGTDHGAVRRRRRVLGRKRR